MLSFCILKNRFVSAYLFWLGFELFRFICPTLYTYIKIKTLFLESLFFFTNWKGSIKNSARYRYLYLRWLNPFLIWGFISIYLPEYHLSHTSGNRAFLTAIAANGTSWYTDQMANPLWPVFLWEIWFKSCPQLIINNLKSFLFPSLRSLCIS